MNKIIFLNIEDVLTSECITNNNTILDWPSCWILNYIIEKTNSKIVLSWDTDLYYISDLKTIFENSWINWNHVIWCTPIWPNTDYNIKQFLEWNIYLAPYEYVLVEASYNKSPVNEMVWKTVKVGTSLLNRQHAEVIIKQLNT